ncbi:uncharacterized protein V1510DRAFT_405601 [Dipodascopsis tothii]|uniref:uncharacterized protein n=1 Tax=Dipodascopsis tothii TaxID=44089 RepID=UPI0034CFC784
MQAHSENDNTQNLRCDTDATIAIDSEGEASMSSEARQNSKTSSHGAQMDSSVLDDDFDTLVLPSKSLGKQRKVQHYIEDTEAAVASLPSVDQVHSQIYVETDVPAQELPPSLIDTSLKDSIGEEKASALQREVKIMQDGLAAILERILKVKHEYEKLEGENKFLQDYIGNLMSTSKMLGRRQE